ncbi:MAG TPA: COX15/CtaA family protein [Candidatus Marinimicrobia bacterium]|jgi:cytochrome c oxidase assembly protein subunit 15|nr:COX15/CtaA family protein [Candidatus Neomarinimicrobiota bacterium]|tara:strand:- start:4493 stop:5473 length:981 start_codon:yes stop_codon:yes gene_type:complete
MTSISSKNLRWFSKIIVFATLLLIFAGALVKSFEVGLSVPDWPTTYGYQMFAFPWADMVGGIFYEHGHRMLATLVGALTLILGIWLGHKESRNSVKLLGFTALVLVIVQGLLGGLTVLYFLPTPISLLHGVIAQTFFLVVILIAYTLSKEFCERKHGKDKNSSLVMVFLIAIYMQLIVGAWMRHTDSGLAIYDFPTMAGSWLPIFNESMLSTINSWRFDMDLSNVSLFQVLIHFIHRLGAFFILSFMVLIHFKMNKKSYHYSNTVKINLYALEIIIGVQMLLGAITIWTAKSPFITSFHVMNGAAVLGVCFVLFLRLSDLSFFRGK